MIKERDNIIHKKFKDNQEYLNWTEIVFFIVILAIIFATSFFNFLLFHSLAEIFSIIIAGGVFLIGWNSRKYTDESYFLILGISSLFVATFDIIHTLAYEGLDIFPEYGANLSAQLWVAGRYILAGSFLFATILKKRKISQNLLLLFYSIFSIILFILIFVNLFPVCFIEGVGLTPFKIISEYIVIVIFISTLILTYYTRKDYLKNIFRYILLIVIFFIFSEFSFTLYHNAYGPLSEIGHILKICAFFLLYRLIVIVGFNNPLEVLFSKLKLNEETMRELASRYYSLFENSQISIWEGDYSDVKKYIEKLPLNDYNNLYKFFDTNQEDLLKCILKIKTLEINNATLSLYKVNNREEFGNRLSEILTSESLDAFRHLFSSFFKGENSLDFETTVKTFTGDIRNVLMRASISPGYEDSWSKIIVTTIDITSRVIAERQLENFVATVSHELRNPITVLKQSLHNLNKYHLSLDESIKTELFDTILRNTDLLGDLINDILLITRLDDNKYILELKKVKPYFILQDLLKLIEPKSKSKNLLIELEVDENLELIADPKRLTQIFRIFIDNAIKYSNENSSVKIIADNNYRGKYNSNKEKGVLFQIIDYGIGIKETDLPNIFKRFFRSAEVQEIPGTGLGLSIAKKLIDLHRGIINISSEFGKGTTVSVFFPQMSI